MSLRVAHWNTLTRSKSRFHSFGLQASSLPRAISQLSPVRRKIWSLRLFFSFSLMDIGNNHSSLPSPRWPDVHCYEVFLSFRGNLRDDFLASLYNKLSDYGIDTFMDHEGIGVGEDIMSKILKVIPHSKICIPIFSKDFSSSTSCLEEVAEMVACDRTIMPIFYDVSPSVVGKQEESYQKSFCTHAALGVMSATIDSWKNALYIASERKGWELEKLKNREKLINEVVSTVYRLLRPYDLDVTEDLVGMDQPVQEMMEKLGIHYENGDVVEGQTLTGQRVVEISGISGIGKTTLATVVYKKICHLFEGRSFLKDIHGKVKEKQLISLQENLIGDLLNKKCKLQSSYEGTMRIKCKFGNLRVLIILDDVSDFEQINSLVRDPSWFGLGSRIIVISMRSNLIDRYSQRLATSRRSSDVNTCNDILIEKYELKKMNDDNALHLFCKHALGREPLQEEFSYWARSICSAAEGLPLVIRAVGLSLYGKSISFWEEAWDRLNQVPFDRDVERTMKTRYKALQQNAREIFLDIACFFTGMDKTIPSYMWKACQFHPYRGLDELHNMSLVKTTENNELWMQNQLKVLGRKIVKKENPKTPSKRSRLWNQEDTERVLKTRKRNAVEALSATFDDSPSFRKRRFFRNFSNLRYLRINHAIFKGNEQSDEDSGEDPFLPGLKWLEWQWCHNISTLLALDLSRLVVLDLSWCTAKTWKRWKKIMEKAKNLKVLILEHCRRLAESPVSQAPKNLERLNLEHCSILPGVGRSTSKLRKLVSLNIKFCSRVQALPEDIGYLEDLAELYIDGTSIKAIDFPEGSCGKLQILSACNCKFLSLPESIGNLKSLLYLAWDETELSELPDSIVSLEKLQTLSLRKCLTLLKLPGSIGNLIELQLMDLSNTSVTELPSSVQYLRKLKVLKMARTFIREFPEGIKNLESLEEIDFSGCISLTGECDIRGLPSLRVLLLEKTYISMLRVLGFQFSNLQNLIIDAGVPISGN